MSIDLTQKEIKAWKRLFKLALFVLWALLFLTGIVLTVLFFRHHSPSEGVALLQSFVGAERALIVGVILVLYVLRTVIYVPVSLLGALLGIILADHVVLAFLLAIFGTTLSGLASFGIARALGRKWVSEHETPRLRAFDEKVRARGFFTILILRLLIFVPFDLISLFSGFSGIAFRGYLWGTVLGSFPEVAVQVLIGNIIMEPKNIILLVIVGIATVGLAYFFKTHPHFRGLINPIARLQKFRHKRKQKKMQGGRRKRF